MSYIPNTESDIAEMIREIGVKSADELFAHIPHVLRMKGELDLPQPLPEMELMNHLREKSRLNRNVQETVSFLGGGVYHHYIPAVVGHLVGRSEFYTSYTPYQPELSQGTLQAIFEYQTLMCMLTGMDVSNASLYDGATAAAEAVLMSLRSTKRDRVVVSGTLNPDYREVIRTYLKSSDREIIEIPFTQKGITDVKALTEIIDDTVACVVLQSPNFFGVIEDLGEYERIIHEVGAHLIATFSEPLAFGLLRPPGECGADIVCGEGQSLGIAPGFGGPYLGILTCKKELLRNIPGRIAGKAKDVDGRTAYVLTLTAREQHIRREKATSNICTNQGLCALTATVYLASLGKTGFRKVALLNHSRAEYARKKLSAVNGVRIKFESPTFNEFVIETAKDPEIIVERSLRDSIVPGIPLKKYHPELANCLLVTVTEMNSQNDVDKLCSVLENI